MHFTTMVQHATARVRPRSMQFDKSPDVTRWNVFIDAVRTVASASRRIIFAAPGQKTYIQVDPPQAEAGQPPARP